MENALDFDQMDASSTQLFRVRFSIPNEGDSRPMTWPIPYPCWETGYGSGRNDKGVDIETFTMVAYATHRAYLDQNWPGILEIDFAEPVEAPSFTERFPKPDWYTGPSVEMPVQRTFSPVPTLNGAELLAAKLKNQSER